MFPHLKFWHYRRDPEVKMSFHTEVGRVYQFWTLSVSSSLKSFGYRYMASAVAFSRVRLIIAFLLDRRTGKRSYRERTDTNRTVTSPKTLSKTMLKTLRDNYVAVSRTELTGPEGLNSPHPPLRSNVPKAETFRVAHNYIIGNNFLFKADRFICSTSLVSQ